MRILHGLSFFVGSAKEMRGPRMQKVMLRSFKQSHSAWVITAHSGALNSGQLEIFSLRLCRCAGSARTSRAARGGSSTLPSMAGHSRWRRPAAWAAMPSTGHTSFSALRPFSPHDCLDDFFIKSNTGIGNAHDENVICSLESHHKETMLKSFDSGRTARGHRLSHRG